MRALAPLIVLASLATAARAEPAEAQPSGNPAEGIHADQAVSVGGAGASGGDSGSGGPIGQFAPIRSKLSMTNGRGAATPLGSGTPQTTATAGCAAPAGWTCSINPLSWATGTDWTQHVPLNVARQTTYRFRVPANTIHAFPIKYDSKVFTGDKPGFGGGAVLITDLIVEDQNPVVMVISDAPGKMARLRDPTGYAADVLKYSGCSAPGYPATIYVTFFPPSKITWPPAPADAANQGQCLLKKDTQYWLNISPPAPNMPSGYLLQPAWAGAVNCALQPAFCGGSDGTIPPPTENAPAPTDDSVCTLPDGTTLAASGASHAVPLWYKSDDVCYEADFYCSNGALTYGVQFSPAPPPPTGTARFMDRASCR